MKKKGFTLIELLAVIIILAVIALIATPVILNVVENARRSAFQQSANGYYDAARYLYDELYLNNDRQDLMFTFDNGIQNSTNENYKLQVKGEVPKGGMVYLNEDGEILVSIHNGKYCATTNGMGQVSISEDVENCGYSSAECFTYSDFTLTPALKTSMNRENQGFEGMDDTLLQIDSFDKENPSCKGIVIIPEEHEGRKVEGIKANAFTGSTSITSVVLPKELKILNNAVFAGTRNLKKVIMNSELRIIGANAFRNSNLSEITIPEKVVTIGAFAFSINTLEKVNILNSMAYMVNGSMFNGVTEITDIYIGPKVQKIPAMLFFNKKISKLTIEDGLSSIGSKAFYNNQLTNIIIPNSVTTIENEAFYNNQLTNVTISNSVTTIGRYAFTNNQLPDDQAFIYARNIDGTEDRTTIIGYGGAKRENVIIPNNVTTIGEFAFGNNQLTSVTIPNSVTTIGEFAFYVNQLTNMIIPDSVTTIGRYAFTNNQLTNVTIPNNVTTIGEFAFGNNQLTSVTIPNSVTTIENEAFCNNQLTNVTIPNSVITIGQSAFCNNQLTNVTIPNSVITIGEYAFGNNQLTNVTIPNSVTTIENNAFADNQLINVTIPSSVTTIGYNAFLNNQFPNADAITIEGDSTRFDNSWTSIGFPAK